MSKLKSEHNKRALALKKEGNPFNRVGDLVVFGQRFLSENQAGLTFNDPMLEAKILAEHAFGLSPTQLLVEQKREVSAEQIDTFLLSLCARESGQPIAYIIREQAFWTLSLCTSEDTLIPRSDTESLVETALQIPLPKNADVLDLGTGTGAIALALKSERAEWNITGADFKRSIVELAVANAKRNNLDVSFLKSDWFSAFEDQSQCKYHLIVSNPPYVESNSPYLEQGDLKYEPRSALSSGMDGLTDIRHIISHAARYLHPQGYVMLEHGFEQAKAIRVLFSEAGFENTTTCKDLNHLDRVTYAQFNQL